MTTKTEVKQATFADLLLALNIPIEQANASYGASGARRLYGILTRIEYVPDTTYGEELDKPDYRNRMIVGSRPRGKDDFYTIKRQRINILYRGVQSFEELDEKKSEKIGYLFTQDEKIASFTAYQEALMKEIAPVVQACRELGITVNGL